MSEAGEVTLPTTSDVRRPSRRSMSDVAYSWLLVSPALLIIFVFALYPLGYAIALSMRHVDLTSAVGIGPYVGLDNYRLALHDPQFWVSTGRTMTFAMAVVAIEMSLGIWIAFLLNGIRWFKGLFRSFLLLPLAASPAAVGLIWRNMYHADFGVFNSFMAALGLPEQNWLGDNRFALASVMLFDVWQWTPFVAVIALAGLQSLPREPFEAAELDGASTWMVLRRLTFPMLAPVLTLVFVLRSIDAVRLYDPILMLTQGGPGTVTETLTFYLYRVGMKFFRLDQASSMALLFLYATVVFCLVVMRRLMRQMAARAERR